MCGGSPQRCPVCESGRLSLFLEGEELELTPDRIGSSRVLPSHGRILRCRDCTFGFRQFRPSDEQLNRLYTQADAGAYEDEKAGRTWTAEWNAGVVLQHRAVPGRILDVGCASGAFLKAMLAHGWSGEGVEPAAVQFALASEALTARCRLHQCSLQEAKLEGQFDVVSLWDVLEHVPDPLPFLCRCRDLLAPGGLIVLNVPDLDSFQARLLGRRWPLLLAEHLNYFNLGSLRKCAARAGLAWAASGRRPVAFSLAYILHRLGQHRFPLANTMRAFVGCSFLARIRLPIWMGERYAVLRRSQGFRQE